MARSRTIPLPPPQIALLRAVNVGGHGKVSMAELRTLLTRRGFADVRTLLQTGNLILRGAPASGVAELERLLEAELKSGLGLATDVFVRSAEEWARVVTNNPFPDQACRDPSHLLVAFLRQAPSEADLDATRATAADGEQLEAVGRHVYITYPNGIGRSKLRSPGGMTAATARNWNTVLRLAAALESPD